MQGWPIWDGAAPAAWPSRRGAHACYTKDGAEVGKQKIITNHHKFFDRGEARVRPTDGVVCSTRMKNGGVGQVEEAGLALTVRHHRLAAAAIPTCHATPTACTRKSANVSAWSFVAAPTPPLATISTAAAAPS